VVGLAWGVVSLCALAQTGDALIQSLKPDGYVTDRANLLSANSETQLETLLAELEQKTTAEIAVVTLPSMEGGQIDDFTNRLFEAEAWRPGQAGKDNGLMLLVAVEERKMRIEVGYGLEGVIPDGRAGQIRDQIILPAFKAGQMEAGIVQGTLECIRILESHYQTELTGERPARTTVSRSSSRSGLNLVDIIWLLFILFLVGRGFVLPLFIPSMRSRGRGFGGGYGYHGGGFGSGGGFGGGGFGGGGFGGGFSGGGGASGGW